MFFGALESSCTGVPGWSSSGEISLETKRGFPCFSWKQINWYLQGGNHIDVHHGRCANSLEFSCLLWQPVINFSALWKMSVPKQVQYRTQLDFTREKIMNFERSKFNSLLKKIASKHWEPLKRKVVTYSKEVLWIDFELVQDLLGPKGQKIYDNLDWFEGDDLLRLRTAMCGTNRLERAVSPECNEIVSSERNLKNKCKNLERQPLQRLPLCRRRLDKVEIIFLQCIWWTTERTIPRKRRHPCKRWSY